MIAYFSGKIQAAPTGPNPLQAAPIGPNLILTAGEVAKILRISKSKVYRMMQQGEIPSVKFGRTSRVRHQDLNDFIQNHFKPNGTGSWALKIYLILRVRAI
jgi:excisionase family DNA binding protein